MVTQVKLSLLSPERRAPFQEDLDEIKRCEAALADPVGLTDHRKQCLQDRIQAAYCRIQEKEAPPETKEGASARQREAIKSLMNAEEVFPRLKQNPDLFSRLCLALHLATGCTQQPEAFREEIKRDPSALFLKRSSFLGLKEGTVLEQLDEALEPTPEKIELQRTHFLACYGDMKVSRRHMKALYWLMPQEVQQMVPPPPYYGRGFDPKLHERLGARYDPLEKKTRFRVYAPHANKVTLNLTAYGKIEHSLFLAKKKSGIWSAKTDKAPPGRTYHLIVGNQRKVDPFAFRNYIHPGDPKERAHESVVVNGLKEFPWTDQAWMKERAGKDPKPMAIYEVHLPTWKRGKNYRELAHELAAYCKEMHYSHVELMGVVEHPQEISMGYQITNFFAANCRMGNPEDFQYFVNFLHNEGIGVILDWVPAHFAIDPFGLSLFDGTPLFEDDDPKFALHPQWGTKQFDFSKQFAVSFLMSNADFFLNAYHIDAFRVDAVQSMLDLNYGHPARTHYNPKGRDINTDAKAFLRHFNTYVHQTPGVFTIAEEASGYKNLVVPVGQAAAGGRRGMGFDLLWNMGWTNDTLAYMQTSFVMRKVSYASLVKTVRDVDGGEYACPRGKSILALSYDESANGKKALLKKMPGTEEEQFANGRLLLSYQLLRGGGPILEFMGNELLQTMEWRGRLIHQPDKPSVEWELLEKPYHKGAHECAKALHALFASTPFLWDQTSFEWIVNDDKSKSAIAFKRGDLACVFNFSKKDFTKCTLPGLSKLEEIFNSDETRFAGKGRTNPDLKGSEFRLAPFTAIVFKKA